MTKNVRNLYRQFERAPFPRLGKSLDAFPLYDASIAGLGSRASKGLAIGIDEIPDVDDETEQTVRNLRKIAAHAPDEREFLEYFDLLQRLVGALRAHAASGSDTR